MAKPSKVIQRESELLSEFYERLCEAFRVYMPIGPATAGPQMVINVALCLNPTAKVSDGETPSDS